MGVLEELCHVSRGSSPFIPSIFYYSGTPLFLFGSDGNANTKKQTDAGEGAAEAREGVGVVRAAAHILALVRVHVVDFFLYRWATPSEVQGEGRCRQ